MTDPAPAPETEDFAFAGYEGRLLRHAGSRGLVIVPTGVGQLGQRIESFDFQRSLSQEAALDTLLLRDQLRSWYSAPEGWSALLAHCAAIAARRDYAFVTLLGISMGAFGALRLAEHFPQANVLCFGAVYSTDLQRHGRAVLRHKHWIDAQPDHRGQDIPLSGDPRRYLLAFGDLSFIDIMNAERFLRAGWPQVVFCPGSEHNVAGFLTRQGRMPLFRQLLAEGAPTPVMAAATGGYLAHAECPAFQLLRAKDALSRADGPGAERYLALAAAGSPADSPTLLRLRLLAAGLHGSTGRAVALLRQLGGSSVTLPLGEAATATLYSSEVWKAPAGPLLGPLVRILLRGPAITGRQEIRLRLRADMPPALQPGGDARLRVFQDQGGKLETLAMLRRPADLAEFTLRGGGETVEFFLRRPAFLSPLDLLGNDDERLWSIQPRQLELVEDGACLEQ